MIIRHDLELVFMHIPKCAGKEIRRIIKSGSNSGNCSEMWNYEYNDILGRYVDKAHLPMSDLRTYKEYKYIKKYTVIACIRNPYLRLRSSIREFYRQKSKKTEIMVKEGKITDEMERYYLHRMKKGHAMLDPRYIHSLPMHRFTHYGKKPIIDYYMRCENLKKDFLEIAKILELPDRIKNDGISLIRNEDQSAEMVKCSNELKNVAEELYKADFNTFNYKYEKLVEEKQEKRCVQAGEVDEILDADIVEWHWGPRAEKEDYKLKMRK